MNRNSVTRLGASLLVAATALVLAACGGDSSTDTTMAAMGDEMHVHDDGSEHDYQFDFDPKSGRWEFSERDLLERDFGEEWCDELEAEVLSVNQGTVLRVGNEITYDVCPRRTRRPCGPARSGRARRR